MRRLAALLPLAAMAAPASPGPLSAEDVFRAAPISRASISPDGRHLGAIVTDKDDQKNLLIFDLKNFKPEGLRGFRDYEISSFSWLTDSRVVFNVSKDKIYSWGLYAADLGHLERLAPIDQFDGLDIIGVPRERPGRVIVWIRQSARDQGRPGDLVEMNASRNLTTYEEARQGESVVRTFIAPRQGPVIGWMATRSGDVGYCMTWLHAGMHLYKFLPSGPAWREIVLPYGTEAKAADFDDDFLWVVTYAKPAGFALRRMNVTTGALEEPVATDPAYDIGSGRVYFSRATRRLAGVAYMQRRPRSLWFSRVFASAQATIDQKRPDTDNVLVDHDGAERKFLFRLTGPTHPAGHELLDLDARTLNILGNDAPALAGRALTPVQPVGFTARDGMKLEGYLAVPAGTSKAHRAPLVVLAHGGPSVRDTSEYNPEVQFLTSRGYAVLQPNYRGSTGYTPEVSRDPAFAFRRMCDDVTDATHAILATGLIDPKHVAIMGASFGGYLAVSGVAFESGLYCCAITECGVFDWDRMIKSKSDVARPGEYEILVDEVGKPGRDDRMLDRISPLEHADKITVPVLIAHGVEDQVVDVAQSKKLASALKRRGVPYETFYRPVEGHGFRSYDDRVAFYHRVEAFLARYMGGATLTPP